MLPKRASAWFFIVVTYAVSWLFWIPAALTGQTSTTFPTALLYMLGGTVPSAAALILAWRTHTGEARSLWARTIDFKRISLGGYALALLLPPAVTGISLLVNSLSGSPAPVFTTLPQMIAQPAGLISLIVIGIIAGPLSEEIGWRGYALDRLQTRWSLLVTSLVLGLVWWGWHLPLFFIKGTLHYEWGVGSLGFWAFLFTVFPLSVLMTLVVKGNRGSILAAVLLHFSFNFTISLLYPLSQTIFAIQAVVFMLAAAALAAPKLHGLTVPPPRPSASPD